MKLSPRACRHCKSPAKGNPCWWGLDNPQYRAGGGDPPCFGDFYNAQRFWTGETTSQAAGVIVGIALVIGLCVWLAR